MLVDAFACHSTSPQPAQLGINRLWVSAPCRRKGIASKLLDAARYNYAIFKLYITTIIDVFNFQIKFCDRLCGAKIQGCLL